ncbi:MAG: uroporphyrin-III methyltransferase, partial [Hyphomicrobiales bacterium]|nr:uroporphyrin-III methyltransferase [Hyphomicrobiales bacterium]
LATLAAKARAAELRGPSILIVGTVVALRDKLDWYAPAAEDVAHAVPAGENGKD